MLTELGENVVNDILSDYSCPLNADVEHFLLRSAVVFAQQSIAQTYLVFLSHQDKPALVGYYTLASKVFTITKRSTLSRRTRDRIKKFTQYVRELDVWQITAPLIAQLGKNYTSGFDKLIAGDELLELACRKIEDSQKILGGKVAYLECEDHPSLIDFYKRNGFFPFDRRSLDTDEKNVFRGDHLVQLIKYFSK